MKKTILLISLIFFTAQLYGFALKPLSQTREIKLHSLLTEIREVLDNRKVVTKSKGEFTFRAEIVENTLFVHLMKNNVLDSSAILSIGDGGATAELGQSDFGDMKNQGVLSQLTKYAKTAILNETVWEDMILNIPTIKYMINSKAKTLDELKEAFLKTPIGKLMTMLGFNEFSFKLNEEESTDQFLVTEDNISMFSDNIGRFGYFFIEAKKVDIDAQYKAICDQSGCEYKGFTEDEDLGDGEIIEGCVWFNHSVSHSTLLIPRSEFSLESLNKKLREHEVVFDIEVNYEASVEVEPEIEEHEQTIIENLRQGILQAKRILEAL